jgi:RAB protein geranylgeranyltransferase component A
VLHIDRNPYYGGEGASLNLTNLWKLFRSGKDYPPQLGIIYIHITLILKARTVIGT